MSQFLRSTTSADNIFQSLAEEWNLFTRSRWGSFRYVLEVAVVIIWAMYVGRTMLDRDPNTLVTGGESIYAYGRFFWDHVQSCGTCALWSGEVRGGYPTYIDSNVDTFHPIVAIPALLVGTLQGFKLTIVLCLVMGGIACWWLALELGTDAIARLAAGFMGAAGGYLTGRSIQGLVVVMTSLAAAAFVLPALFRLRRIPSRRSAAILGIVIGQLLIAGQGYAQLGIAMLAPIFLILLAGNLDRWRIYLWRIAQALCVGVLIGSIFLFPFLRYYPQFTKLVDQGFGSHQEFRFIVLNFVINDNGYFDVGTVFDMKPYPGFHSSYLGWGVIIFAVVGGFVLWNRAKPTLIVLLLITLGALWIGSGAPFQLFAQPWAPDRLRDFGYSVRNPSFIAMAASPAIIGLAAVGVDAGLNWTAAVQANGKGMLDRTAIHRGASIVVRLATIILLVVSARNLEDAAAQWLPATRIDQGRMDTILDSVSTDELAWVSPALGDWSPQLVGFHYGLKLGDGLRSWDIAGFGIMPPTYLAFRYDGEYLPDENMELAGRTPYGEVYRSRTPNPYATSSTAGTCSAHGEGGKISVRCDVQEAGILTIQENALSDWTATVNGQDAQITNGSPWISVQIPEGASSIELRYQPWDFWVALALTICGIVGAIVMLFLPERVHLHVRFNRPRTSLLNSY